MRIIYLLWNYRLFELKMGSIYDLRELIKVVYWCPSKNRYVMNTGSKRDSLELNIVVYWRS